jgi:hypothetical protein
MSAAESSPRPVAMVSQINAETFHNLSALTTLALLVGLFAFGNAAFLSVNNGLTILLQTSVIGLLGTTMGWADETLGFYALLIPLMLTLGYDRMVVAGAIIASATVGAMASTKDAAAGQFLRGTRTLGGGGSAPRD